MKGVDVHAFRKTHQTWAEAQGIPAVLIDKQLGHSVGSKGLEVFKAVRALSGGSRTGRKHYLDLGSKLDALRRGRAVAARCRHCGARERRRPTLRVM